MRRIQPVRKKRRNYRRAFENALVIGGVVLAGRGAYKMVRAHRRIDAANRAITKGYQRFEWAKKFKGGAMDMPRSAWKTVSGKLLK